MRTFFNAGISTLFLASMTLTACGGLKSPSSGNETDNSSANQQGYQVPSDYPKGPYGVNVGSIIEDLGFVGVVDPAASATPQKNAADIHLDQFRGKDTVLLLTAAAGWCEYCNMEEPSVVSFYNDETTQGAKLGILEVLINDETLGQPASLDFLARWGCTPANGGEYSVTFDLATDPTGVLNPYFNENALPMHMVITTADMKIQWQSVGEEDSQLDGTLTYYLNNPD